MKAVKVVYFPVLVLIILTTSVHAVDLTIQSIPDNAQLKVNGVIKGTTPLVLAFKPNSLIKISIEKSGYDPIVLDYQVSDQDTLIFDLATGEQVDEAEYLKQLLISSKSGKANEPGEPTATPTPEPAVADNTPVPTETAVPPAGNDKTPAPENTPEPAGTATPAATSPPTEKPTPVPTETPVKTGPIYMPDELDTPPEVVEPPHFGSIPVKIQNLNLKGSASFNIIIGPDGNVADALVVKSTGNEALDKWILPKLKTSFWEPGKRGGKAVSCQKELQMEFYTIACRFHFTNLYK